MTETSQPKGKVLSITLIRSGIGYSQKHKDTLRALGLHRLHQTVIQADTPTVRGMLSKVNHLVVIEAKTLEE
jgi:large subunit ribosomal protein L30